MGYRLFTVPTTTVVVGPVEMVGFMYVCMYVFLRVHSPAHSFGYFELKFGM